MGYQMYVHILIFEYMCVDISYSVYMFENMFIYLLDRSSMIHHAKNTGKYVTHIGGTPTCFLGGMNPGDITQKMWPHQTWHQ
jgi:hypothetical protein